MSAEKTVAEAPPDAMTIDEVAALLRTSTKTVQRMVQAGELRAGRRGRSGLLRFYRPDVVAWLRGESAGSVGLKRRKG